jgi:ABC-type nitrate/sulfonate/bicarbonate transport system substrate-binding protein
MGVRSGLKACATLLALALWAPPVLAADKITIGETGSGSATHWPTYVAMTKGFFKALDIEVEFVPAPSSAAVMQQLAAGSLVLGVSGPGDALRAIDKGAPVRLLRVESQAAPYEVMGKPIYKSLADLRGKIVMVGGAKDITRYYIDRMAAPLGVKPGDYDLVFAGATSQRFAALQSGSIDATILNAPFNFKAKASGFVSLGVTGEIVKDVPFGLLSVNRAWAQANKSATGRFLEGFARGVNWFHDPANREEAIDIFQKISKSERDDAAKTYDFYIAIKMFDPVGAITEQGLSILLADMKRDGDLEGSTDVARFYDPALIPQK